MFVEEYRMIAMQAYWLGSHCTLGQDGKLVCRLKSNCY